MTVGFVFRELPDSAKQSIAISNAEGICYAVMLGAAETYFGAFGVFLGATSFQLAMLTAIPPFFSAFVQMAAVWLLNRYPSRRPMLAGAAALQAVLILPIALLGVLMGRGHGTANWLIALVVLYSGAAGVTAPIWNSLLGDLIPATYRGRYFGIRNQWMGIATLITTLVAGGILHLFSHFGGEGNSSPILVWGYLAIFIIALLARAGSSFCLTRHQNPEYTPERPLPFSLRRFFQRTPSRNFVRFVLFFSLVQAGQAFSAPYYAPYMLTHLHLPYIEYSLILAVPALALILMHPFWGRLVDRIGCKKVLAISSIGVVINPMLWLISSDVRFLLGLQIFSGVAWSGFNLAAAAFLFDAVTPSKRAYYSAYQGLIQGCFVLGGSLLGVYTVERIPAVGALDGTAASPYLTLFFLSGLIRMSGCFFISRFEDGRVGITPAAGEQAPPASPPAFEFPDADRTSPL